MQSGYVKVGAPVNGIQEYEIKDFLTNKTTHKVNIPVQENDKFEKLLDKAAAKALKLGATREEVEKKTQNRFKINTALFATLGLTAGLVLSRGKSVLRKSVTSLVTSIGGAVAGVASSIMPPAAISAVYNTSKAMKLSVKTTPVGQNQ